MSLNRGRSTKHNASRPLLSLSLSLFREEFDSKNRQSFEKHATGHDRSSDRSPNVSLSVLVSPVLTFNEKFRNARNTPSHSRKRVEDRVERISGEKDFPVEPRHASDLHVITAAPRPTVRSSRENQDRLTGIELSRDSVTPNLRGFVPVFRFSSLDPSDHLFKFVVRRTVSIVPLCNAGISSEPRIFNRSTRVTQKSLSRSENISSCDKFTLNYIRLT